MNVLMYLRKSRADLEAEQRGEGETLARHKAALTEAAKRQGLIVTAIYEELESGDTIASRPQMQRLLSEVEAQQWPGVLVMEVERLARGDSIDQGIVAQAFKYSGTKIITPHKTYDPTNEFDEEYFEFGLFMARREYQTIKRRMIAGRIASVKEGKYLGTRVLYGYNRVKIPNDKGYTLEPKPPECDIVKSMFAMRLSGSGAQLIARWLNGQGIKSPAGLAWRYSSVVNILRNCVYAGYVTWGRKVGVPTVKDGVVSKRYQFPDDYIKVKGLHEPLISEDDFDAVQKLINEAPFLPLKNNVKLENPLVGLLYCADCGHTMMLKRLSHHDKKPNCIGRIQCRWRNTNCTNVGSYYEEVEQIILASLRKWLDEYEININSEQAHKDIQQGLQRAQTELTALESEQQKLQSQLERASELVEQGIYTLEHFVTRQAQITARLQEIAPMLSEAKTNLQQIEQSKLDLPAIKEQLRYVLESYNQTESATEKNELLRSVIKRIDYKKAKGKTKGGKSSIELEITRKFSPTP